MDFTLIRLISEAERLRAAQPTARMVTPAMARAFLDAAGVNRPVGRQIVHRYAAAMTAGEWQLTHEGIAFGTDGLLMDGQHRLAAILESGVSVPLFVFMNIDRSVFSKIDIGAKRTAAHILSICGKKNCNVLAASLQLLHQYSNPAGNNNMYPGWGSMASPTSLLDLLGEHPEIELSAKYGKDSTHILTAACGAFSHYVFSRMDKDAADEFFARLADGANLDGGHPVLLLRNRLIRDRAGMTRLPRRTRLALTFKAWNALRRGVVKLGVLRWSPSTNEKFPVAL